MLELSQVHTYYGDSHILQGIDMRVGRGECVALLGPNGMGKTTALRCIMGLTPARRGSVIFNGADITRWPPFRIARLGIGYVPEERGIFDCLTVLQNLKIPFLNLSRKDRRSWEQILDGIYLLFPVLRERREQMAGTLSGGEQQMVATARALISGSEMVLLDEPTEGLAPLVIRDLVEAFRAIKTRGHTILLVEQNIHTAMEIADRCYILEKGLIKVEEPADALCRRPDLLQRYLGVSQAANVE